MSSAARTQADPPGDGAVPTYEAARAELREIVGKLESGGQSLEESLALWERGEQLADVCQRWLDGAGQRLDAAIAAREAGAGDKTDTDTDTDTDTAASRADGGTR